MRRGFRRESGGSVFLLAMVALVCLLFLGTSLVQVAIQGLATASRQQKRSDALALAEAGVDMALAKLYDNYNNANTTLESTGIYTDSFTLGDGTVDYVVTAPFAGIPRSCTIRSTSMTRTNQSETIRLVAIYLDDVDRVFQGAIFCDSNLDLSGGGAVLPDENGVGGTIYANGDINFDTQGNQSFEMDPAGEIYCTGTTNFVPTGVLPENVHENIAPLPMPTIDLQYYRDNATTYFSSGQTFNSPDLTSYGSIIYVNGNVSLSGTYSGQAVLVAAGRITVTGSLMPADATTDAIALVSPKGVKIRGGENTEVHGLIYSHGLTVEADVTVGGSPTIYGAVVADVVRCTGSMIVQYDDVWGGLDVPGKGKSQWAQISWEELLH